MLRLVVVMLAPFPRKMLPELTVRVAPGPLRTTPASMSRALTDLLVVSTVFGGDAHVAGGAGLVDVGDVGRRGQRDDGDAFGAGIVGGEVLAPRPAR